MPIKLEDFDDICVMSVSRNFAGEEVVSARKSAVEAIEGRRIYDFVIDLTDTLLIDSSGLEALLWLKKRCEDQLGGFKLASVNENVRTVLDLTRLTSKFEIAVDVSSALKMLR